MLTIILLLFVPEPAPLPKIPGPEFTVRMVDGTVYKGTFLTPSVKIKVRYGILDVPVGDVASIFPRTRTTAKEDKEAEILLKELVDKKSVTAFQCLLNMGRAGAPTVVRFLEDEKNWPRKADIDLVTSLLLELCAKGVRTRKVDEINANLDQISGELIDAVLPFHVGGAQLNIPIENIVSIRK